MTVEALVMVLALIGTLVGWGISMGAGKRALQEQGKDLGEVKSDVKEVMSGVQDLRNTVSAMRGDHEARISNLEEWRASTRRKR